MSLPEVSVNSINSAGSLAELKEIHSATNESVMMAFSISSSVKAFQEIISDYREKIMIKVIDILEKAMEAEFGKVPAKYAFVCGGSEGRREQTLSTDQDNLIVFEDEALSNPSAAKYFEIFSKRISDGLEQVGIAKCKGNVMASNEEWRNSLGGWAKLLTRMNPREQSDVLKISILLDARHIAGDMDIARKFLDNTHAFVKEHPTFVDEIAIAATIAPVAIGLFNRFRTEKSGPHKDTFDIKLSGLTPLVLSVTAFAAKQGTRATNTVERIVELTQERVIDPEFANQLEETYYSLTKHRILHQIECLRIGADVNNSINPYRLPAEQQIELKSSLRTVEKLQKAVYVQFSYAVFGRF